MLIDIKNAYSKFSTTSLIRLTYLHYQYFAINSVKGREILTPKQYEKVLEAKSNNNKTILYTIGYEAIRILFSKDKCQR